MWAQVSCPEALQPQWGVGLNKSFHALLKKIDFGDSVNYIY